MTKNTKVNKDTVSKLIIKIISENFGINHHEISLQSSFNEDLGADSLDTVELIIGIEEQFNVEISDHEARKMLTVNDVVMHIFGILNNKC